MHSSQGMSLLSRMMRRWGWVRLSEIGLEVGPAGQLVSASIDANAQSQFSFDPKWAEAPGSIDVAAQFDPGLANVVRPQVAEVEEKTPLPTPPKLTPEAQQEPITAKAPEPANTAPECKEPEEESEEDEWAWRAALARARAEADMVALEPATQAPTVVLEAEASVQEEPKTLSTTNERKTPADEPKTVSMSPEPKTVSMSPEPKTVSMSPEPKTVSMSPDKIDEEEEEEPELPTVVLESPISQTSEDEEDEEDEWRAALAAVESEDVEELARKKRAIREIKRLQKTRTRPPKRPRRRAAGTAPPKDKPKKRRQLLSLPLQPSCEDTKVLTAVAPKEEEKKTAILPRITRRGIGN